VAHSYLGCEFWPTVTANTVWSIFDFAVLVANAGTQPASITVTGPGGVNESTVAAPGGVATIYLPWGNGHLKGPDGDSCGGIATPLNGSVLEPGGAYHLVSSVPVAVYQFSALEARGQGGPPGKNWSQCPGTAQSCPPNTGPIGCYSYTNDGSLLLPSHALSGNVRIAGHEGLSPPSPVGPSPTPGISAFAAITATADNTTVHVKVSGTGTILASANGTDIAATGAGGTLTLTMNAGDVAELIGPQSDSSDLSGSLVQASQPVQVITGSSCLIVPDGAPACDHVEESNLPAESLGQDYVVVRPAGPHGNVVGHQVRIVGNVDGTHLTYSPSAPPGCPSTIDAGQVVECGAPLGNMCLATGVTGVTYTAPCGNGNIVSQDFEIKGDHAFAVTTFTEGATLVDQGATPPNQEGDPDQSVVAPVEQFRTSFTFMAPADYQESYAVIVAPLGTIVSIDGALAAATFTGVGTGGLAVARVPLATGGTGAHVVTASAPIGLEVMGYGAYTSYTYPAGMHLGFIAPAPQ
jgi:hypothetical protein